MAIPHRPTTLYPATDFEYKIQWGTYGEQLKAAGSSAEPDKILVACGILAQTLAEVAPGLTLFQSLQMLHQICVVKNDRVKNSLRY